MALDAKIPKRVNENALLKMKETKTVILVTHQISKISRCDVAIIMENGRITKKIIKIIK